MKLCLESESEVKVLVQSGNTKPSRNTRYMDLGPTRLGDSRVAREKEMQRFRGS
jgi:hypothetical protein